MSYQPSPVAAYWVSQYKGSVDATALLLAVDAGIAAGRSDAALAEAWEAGFRLGVNQQVWAENPYRQDRGNARDE